MLIIGLDPSLSCTGWGIIATSGNRLSHVANGQIRTDAREFAVRKCCVKSAVADGMNRFGRTSAPAFGHRVMPLDQRIERATTQPA